MKHLIPKRRWAALLVLGVTLATVASAAVAGGYSGSRRSRAAASCETPRMSASFSWRSGNFRPVAYAGVAVRDRGGYGYSARRVNDEACAVNHPPHYWNDGRLWCGGKNADGTWRSAARCEDDWGRKKVNLPGFDYREELAIQNGCR